MNQSQAIQIYNTLFTSSSARVFAQYEGVPELLEDGLLLSPGKQRAARLLRTMADALDPQQLGGQTFMARYEYGKPPVKVDGDPLAECAAAIAAAMVKDKGDVLHVESNADPAGLRFWLSRP